jgi:formate dehydrogenase iron-sulfur subunit
VEVCPFHVIQFDEEARKAKKCLFCIDRIQYGREPACVETCSTGALEFGGLQEITGKAMEMERQGHRLYGLREAGGVSWIYALPKGIEPKDVGLPVVPHRSYNSFSGSLLVGQTSAVALGLIAVGAFSQYLKRKEKEEGGEKQ